MKIYKHPSHVLGGCLIVQVMCALSVFAEPLTVFEDTMQTTNQWSKGSLVIEDEQVEHAPYLKLGNAVSVAKIAEPITSSWTLSADIKHTRFSRGLWLGLFDAKQQQGYALFWDSSLEKYHNGNGFFLITKIQEIEKQVQFNTKRQALCKAQSGDTKITEPQFSNIKLSWDATSGKLALTVNGKLLLNATDTSFKTFEKVILRGNSDVLLDNVKITVEK